MAFITVRLATALAIPLTLIPLCAFARDLSPTEAYLEMHKKEVEAKSFEDIRGLRSQRSIAAEKAAGRTMTKEDEKMFFPLFKETLPKDVKIIGEVVKGNEATLSATVPPKNQDPKVKESTTGTIVLFKEDGVWKLDSEKWSTKIESTKDLPDFSGLPGVVDLSGGEQSKAGGKSDAK